VSIIIPAYNAGRFIERVVESALAQTYQNIEIIISNDCSTDSTEEILNVLAEQYPNKVKVYNQLTNLGVGQNFNFLLDNCNGDYICLSGGDDLLLPNKVESLMSALKGDSYDIACSNYDFYDLINEKNVINKKKNSECTFTMNEFDSIGVCTITVMVKNSKIGTLRFSEIYPTADSTFFLEYMMKNDCKGVRISDVTTLYGRHENNLNSRHLDNKISSQDKYSAIARDNILSRHELILKFPEYKSVLHKSISNLYRSIRNTRDDKTYYRNIILLSLSYRFNLKSLTLLALSYLGSYR